MRSLSRNGWVARTNASDETCRTKAIMMKRRVPARLPYEIRKIELKSEFHKGTVSSRTRLDPAVVTLGWVSFLSDVASDMIYPLLPDFLTRTLGAGPAALGLDRGRRRIHGVLHQGRLRLVVRPGTAPQALRPPGIPRRGGGAAARRHRPNVGAGARDPFRGPRRKGRADAAARRAPRGADARCEPRPRFRPPEGDGQRGGGRRPDPRRAAAPIRDARGADGLPLRARAGARGRRSGPLARARPGVRLRRRPRRKPCRAGSSRAPSGRRS